jgi:hypothetical protein
VTRRELLQSLGGQIALAAASSLMARDGYASGAADGSPTRKRPHFEPRAKSVIYIHLVGGASHVDLFDPKPVLRKRDGELCPAELFEGKQLAFIRQRPTLLGSPWEFRRCGRSGMEVSALLPHLQQVADEICLIRSMRTDQFNHAPAQNQLLTGFQLAGRPSIGAWIDYGLGSENQDLPGYVVMITGNVLGAGNNAWGSGFLPTVHQGIELRGAGEPVLFLSDAPGIDRDDRKRMVEAVGELNALRLAEVGDPEIETRIRQYEMAYRMQTAVPGVMDIRREPEPVRAAYGAAPGKQSFANNCLLARRLVERGVRFVQLFDEGWDAHATLGTIMPTKCRQVDQPIAALIRDLVRRGLLDETLVLTTEFGRTPMAQGYDGSGSATGVGRDHHREAFSVLLAGGGVKRGFVHGTTDELGYAVVGNPVHVHDLNATILHLLGLDHERLLFKFQGRYHRLTDVHGEVVGGIVA